MACFKMRLVVLFMVLIAKNGAFSCSLQSHKIGSSLCPSSDSDTSSIPNHKSITRKHKVPSIHDLPIPAPSLCSSSASQSQPNDSATSFQPEIPPTTPLPVQSSTTPVASPPADSASHLTDDNMVLLDQVIKLLMPSSGSNIPLIPQVSHASPSDVPSPSTPAVFSTTAEIPKPYAVPVSCSSSPGSNACPLNILPNIIGNSVSPLTVIPDLSQQPPISTPISTEFPFYGANTDLLNFLNKLSSLDPVSTALTNSKLNRLPPLCSLSTPTKNKNASPHLVSKTHTSPYPCGNALGSSSMSSSLSSSDPSGSPSSIKPTVPEGIPTSVSEGVQTSVHEGVSTSVSEGVLTSVPEAVPTSVPGIVPVPGVKRFPENSLAPVPVPATTYTPILTYSSQNTTAVIHLLLKLLCSQAPTISSIQKKPTLLKLCSLITSIPNLIQKPNIVTSTCSTSSGSSSCPSNASILPQKITSVVSKPPRFPVSLSESTGNPPGFNPAFMDHLIKHMLFASHTLPPLSPSLFLNNQPTSITTPVPLINTNPIPSNSNKPDLDPSISNLSSNKSSVPSLNPNKSYSNNLALTNILCELLQSSLSTSKTHPFSCLHSLNPNSIPTLNIPPNPPKLSFDQIFNLLNKFPSSLSNSAPSSLSLNQFSLLPLPFPEPVKNVTPEPFSLVSTSSPPLSGLDPCLQKLLGPLQTPSLKLPGVSPCSQNNKRPLLPPPLPCLKSVKLSSDC